MKKNSLLFLFFILSINAFSQFGASFKLNLQYAQTQRPELESYFAEMSDSMHIASVLDISSGFGFGLGFIGGGEHSEFEVGGSFTRFADEVGSDTSNLLYYINSDITYYFGMNYLPVNFFLVGGSFIINSANAKSNASGPAQGDRFLESLPSVDFHFLRGYSVALRAQSGFYIYLNKDDGNRMRLTAYYIYGLSNYNFYTVSEKRLADFTGDQKTGYTTFGIELAVMWGL